MTTLKQNKYLQQVMPLLTMRGCYVTALGMLIYMLFHQLSYAKTNEKKITDVSLGADGMLDSEELLDIDVTRELVFNAENNKATPSVMVSDAVLTTVLSQDESNLFVEHDLSPHDNTPSESVVRSSNESGQILLPNEQFDRDVTLVLTSASSPREGSLPDSPSVPKPVLLTGILFSPLAVMALTDSDSTTESASTTQYRMYTVTRTDEASGTVEVQTFRYKPDIATKVTTYGEVSENKQNNYGQDVLVSKIITTNEVDVVDVTYEYTFNFDGNIVSYTGVGTEYTEDVNDSWFVEYGTFRDEAVVVRKTKTEDSGEPSPPTTWTYTEADDGGGYNVVYSGSHTNTYTYNDEGFLTQEDFVMEGDWFSMWQESNYTYNEDQKLSSIDIDRSYTSMETLADFLDMEFIYDSNAMTEKVDGFDGSPPPPPDHSYFYQYDDNGLLERIEKRDFDGAPIAEGSEEVYEYEYFY